MKYPLRCNSRWLVVCFIVVVGVVVGFVLEISFSLSDVLVVDVLALEEEDDGNDADVAIFRVRVHRRGVDVDVDVDVDVGKDRFLRVRDFDDLDVAVVVVESKVGEVFFIILASRTNASQESCPVRSFFLLPAFLYIYKTI